MTHRGGLSYAFTTDGAIAKAYEAALGDPLRNPYTPDEWMRRLARLPLLYPPGERFHYSVGIDVLGFIIGRIAGKPFRQVLMERLFTPLGMKDTDFYVPPEKRDRAAVLYHFDAATNALKPVPALHLDTPPDFCGGGGGLTSTIDDYLTFARMLLNKGSLDGRRYLKPETVAMMTTNRLTDAQREVTFLGLPFWLSQGFGLGVSMVLDPAKQEWMGSGSKGAFGWPGAFGTWWQADPVEDMVLIYMVQNAIPLTPGSASQLATGQGLGGRGALAMFQKTVYAALR
jgi:CubicO group peptidase (beta-lactamase class C family)